MKTETNQLKPCPFCGRAAMTATAKNGLTTVACTECECEFGWFESYDAAVEAWNTRAERTCKNVWKDWSEWHALFECSVCGAYSHRFIRHKDGTMDSTRYCPHCGAKVVD